MMEIPKTIPFDTRTLNQLWNTIGSFKLSRREESERAKIVGDLNTYRQGAGLPRRDYRSVQEMCADLNILLRIAKVKERRIENHDRVMVKGVPGTVLELVQDGRLRIHFDYGPIQSSKVEPKLVERAA